MLVTQQHHLRLIKYSSTEPLKYTAHELPSYVAVIVGAPVYFHSADECSVRLIHDYVSWSDFFEDVLVHVTIIGMSNELGRSFHKAQNTL